MTDEELRRLDELDNIIAWQADGGRPLTEEEHKEHSRLAWQLLKEGEERGIVNYGKRNF